MNEDEFSGKKVGADRTDGGPIPKPSGNSMVAKSAAAEEPKVSPAAQELADAVLRKNDRMIREDTFQKLMNDPEATLGPEPTVRGAILDRAKELTNGAREADYGGMADNMACLAALLDAYIMGRFRGAQSILGEVVLNGVDAACIMALTKIARIAGGDQSHRDSYVDGAAYLAMAGECAEQKE